MHAYMHVTSGSERASAHSSAEAGTPHRGKGHRRWEMVIPSAGRGSSCGASWRRAAAISYCSLRLSRRMSRMSCNSRSFSAPPPRTPPEPPAFALSTLAPRDTSCPPCSRSAAGRAAGGWYMESGGMAGSDVARPGPVSMNPGMPGAEAPVDTTHHRQLIWVSAEREPECARA